MSHEAGWSSHAASGLFQGLPTGLCSIDEEGYAGFTNTAALVSHECDYSYFASTGEPLRLAAPWTLVSIDVNFSPLFPSHRRSWTSAPQSGSDNIFFSFRLTRRGMVVENAAGIDRVVLLGPEGADWRDALE